MSGREQVTVEYYNRGTRRRPNYWVRFRLEGQQHREPTGLKTEVEAKSFTATMERKIRRGEWSPAPKGQKKKPYGLTFGLFAPTGLAQRIAMGVKTAAKDERGHLENHLVPEFGQCAFEDLTHQRICTGFATIAGKGLSGATLRNVHNTFHAILRLAGKAGHLHTVPARLRVSDNDLPPVVDARPEGWRDAAWFTPDEVHILLGCEAIELQYRVMHMTWLMCGARFAEVTPLLVRSWDPERKPLGSMTIRAIKLRRDKGPMYRVVPVHPEYAEWLSWWLHEGFELNHGHPPRPDDLMFPTLSTRRKFAPSATVLTRSRFPARTGKFSSVGSGITCRPRAWPTDESTTHEGRSSRDSGTRPAPTTSWCAASRIGPWRTKSSNPTHSESGRRCAVSLLT